MGNFNRGGNRGRGPRQMFPAKCSDCGNDCEIPFMPRNGRPVFCSDCFEKQGGNSNNSRPERRNDRNNNRGNDRSYKEDFTKLNDKLDKIIELLNSQAVDVVPEKKPVIKKVKAKKNL